MKPESLVILSGVSGSGKSAAVRCFEDLGYFCVDNLPLGLIPVFIDLMRQNESGPERVALVIDIREGSFLQSFPENLEELRQQIDDVEVLFFEAASDVLVRRFSETRRPHPLAEGSVEDAIAREREALRPLRDRADRIIDTSKFNVHELKQYLLDHFAEGERHRTLFVAVESFGYKHGAPKEADLVFDVRFFPNPYFVDHLRAKNGLDDEVVEFLEAIPEYPQFCAKIDDLLQFLLPQYVKEGKSYLTVALGCTGGKHRSVALAERIGSILRSRDYRIRVDHRDIAKE